ncbi:MAG: GNAT family N-acetyltransferase [Sedimenticolaceae bacterium]|jgi:GNAT superfamily N-acetyltransferase
MPEPHVVVRTVDFTNTADVKHYLGLLDAYARDPMGGGKPLPAEVRGRLAADLARHPGVHCLLAEHGGRAVGFASCFLGYSTFQARPLLNIHDIAVLAEWRGQSIAQRLLQAIGELARRLGCCRITLEVRTDNPRARQLYERAGFSPGQCSLFMEKPL